MPTLDRFDGFRIVIYPNDHRPAHVHVIGADGEAVFFLNCPEGPPELRETYGLSRRSLGPVRTFLADRLAVLCDGWDNIHGL
ncbi:DUF4160 domain-containing protein [Marinibaculum pumilum]|uniref:DUF4160 domain-containing protein n=1 Tax=Marinibaculum pumilum TaxID=1766165 RepID=A0ABV7KWS5_9PROT